MMLRAVSKLLSLSVVLTIGLVGIFLYREHTAGQREKEALENEVAQQKQIVQRLTSERRVAQLLVTGQKVVDGVPHTTLLFMEYDRNGEPLPPKTFTIIGDQIHLDAMVIKFDHKYVEQKEWLRNHSIALFTRIFGNRQSPDQGSMIDVPGHVPEYYKGTDPRVSQFETQLWNNFWKLADDKAYRDEMGVRVSDGEGKWWPCQPDRLYTVTIEADGGLNVTFEPIPGIYREALHPKTAETPGK